ncbi:MAG: HNH endonuclease [Planctomycetaceae bacterium]|nr:HNH endonuclease [Planctomycetaceae bacterium]
MRPVERGAHPLNSRGERVAYGHYSEARGELIKRLGGEYCSFCEMHLDASLAIEHVQPKSKVPSLEKSWENFLLACQNCNSTKGDEEIVLGEYVWPDVDNTAACLKYGPGALVRPADLIDDSLRTRTRNTIDLVALDWDPSKPKKRKNVKTEGRDSASDRRWANREEAWDIAKDARNDLKETILDHGEDSRDAIKARRRLISEARGHGYWSVWMTVFADDFKTRQLLIQAFKAAASCFDPSTTQPQSRAL